MLLYFLTLILLFNNIVDFGVLFFSLYFSIYMYILTITFFIIFVYLVNFYNQLNNSVKLNIIDTTFSIKINFFLFLGSLIGIPPLMGFFGKLIMFINLMFFQKFFAIIIFIILNLFLLIFYLQQVKYIHTNKQKNVFFKSNVSFNYGLNMLVVFFQFFNIFSVLFVPYFFEFFVLSSV